MPRTVLLVLVASAASLLLATTAPSPTADDGAPRAEGTAAGTADATAAASAASSSAAAAAFLSGRLADDAAAGDPAIIARTSPPSVAASDGADDPTPAGATRSLSPATDTTDRASPADSPLSAMAADLPWPTGPDRLHSTGPPTDPADHGPDDPTEPAGAPDDGETMAPPVRRALASPEGYLVAGGSSRAGDGREVTFTVEVEAGVDVALPELVATVEAALYDPASWAHDHPLRRVDDPSEASIRVLLASPATVDGLCARVGLRTNGIFSCWNGRFAALNAMRWVDGAEGFADDPDGYRRYLVNHEFGHGLGYGHVGCPAPGAPAPVMMQQTKDTGACVPNGWPYPHLASDATG